MELQLRWEVVPVFSGQTERPPPTPSHVGFSKTNRPAAAAGEGVDLCKRGMNFGEMPGIISWVCFSVHMVDCRMVASCGAFPTENTHNLSPVTCSAQRIALVQPDQRPQATINSNLNMYDFVGILPTILSRTQTCQKSQNEVGILLARCDISNWNGIFKKKNMKGRMCVCSCLWETTGLLITQFWWRKRGEYHTLLRTYCVWIKSVKVVQKTCMSFFLLFKNVGNQTYDGLHWLP